MVERVLGAGWRMLVLGWALVAVQDLGEVEDRAVGQVVAVMVPLPVP